MKDRGYTKIHRIDLAEFNQSNPVIQASGDNGAIDVYFHLEERVGVKYSRAVVELSNNRNVIIVSEGGATSFTKKEFERKNVQFFIAKSLCYNVTKHILVPHFEVVTSLPEIIKVADLPLILETDPIVQYYDWKPGTIVRVWRKFAGSEPIPYLRTVVHCFSN